MIRSIKKYSKSFFFKLLVGIIILPFVFWGMGDVFSSGSQNVVAKIDSKKISTQDFVNYIKRLNLNENQINELKNANLIDRILSDYIAKKVLVLELENLNLFLSDRSLRNMILNDKIFFKDGKFSRTEYEKFLITNNLSAALFERNLSEQEKKRQLLSYLSDGINIPNFIVQYEYNKEYQKKEIEYVDLKEFYNKPFSEEKIKEAYEENKTFFSETFKNIKFAELSPEIITGNNEPDDNYFLRLSEIENKALDDFSFNSIKDEYNLNILETGLLNKNSLGIDGKLNSKVDKSFFDKAYLIQDENSVEFLENNGKYYIAEIFQTKKVDKKITDKDVSKTINAQLQIERKIAGNTKIAKDITNKKLDRLKIEKFAKENNLQIIKTTLNNINDNKIFTKGVIKRIFETNDNEINLITDNMLKDNYIIFSKKTTFMNIDIKHPDYEKYKLKAKLSLANQMYAQYDISLNEKYNVDINNKALDRIKNSF